MALLIGTVSRTAALLTADGRCVRGTKTFEEYQKVYPVRGKAFAVAVWGTALLDWEGYAACEPYQVLQDIFDKERGRLCGHRLRDVAGLLAKRIDASVRASLEHHQDAESFGLVVAGFSPRSPHTEAFEVAWPRPVGFQELHDSFALGGGAHHIRNRLQGPGADLRLRDLHGMSMVDRLTYHKKVYDAVLASQNGTIEHRVGGQRHSLGISQKGCYWLEKPHATPIIEL